MPHKNTIFFHILILIACFWITWSILGLFNYGYSFWYDALDIGAFVQELGPVNKFKPGLELLSKEDHVNLFAQINTAIQGQPQMLAGIHYIFEKHSNVVMTVPLLRAPEIQHLEDVAHLVEKLHIIGMIALISAAIYRLLVKNVKRKKEHIKTLGIIWIFLILISIITALTQPVALFYWFHTHLFPEGHKWFFYYQESLMTTLMKAPDLFGAIAVELLAFTLLLHAVTAYFHDQAAARLSQKISSNEISAE